MYEPLSGITPDNAIGKIAEQKPQTGPLFFSQQ